MTTPTEESVRRALAIQLIIQRELGLSRNENPLQGAYVIEELTDRVEEAVLEEFERLSERGGVLGAMETLYQRGRIQDESLHYESQKHSGALPIVGVNTFENPDAASRRRAARAGALERGGEARAAREPARLPRAPRRRERPRRCGACRRWRARAATCSRSCCETVKVASLGQIMRRALRGGRALPPLACEARGARDSADAMVSRLERAQQREEGG